MAADPSDEELLDAFFEGDAMAFELFFKRHAGRVAGYAAKKGVPRNDLNDFTQDVFAEVVRCIHRYEKGRPALPWFFSIVHNKSVDWVRTQVVRQRVESEITMNESTSQPDSGFTDKIERGLKNLSDEQRTVVDLRIQSELSFKEISEQTGRTEASSRKLFQRALEALRSRLGGKDEQ